jgi:hypothetical protein
MNATMLGKTLVFVNLTLSIVFAAMAVGLYTNHIDWPGGGGPSVDKSQGEYNKRKAERLEREKIAQQAMARWQAATAVLSTLEYVEVPKQRKWFAEKLESLEKSNNDVLSLVYGQNGKLQLLAAGQPIPGPIPAGMGFAALKPREFYKSELAKTQVAIDKEIADSQRFLEVAKNLTIEINGTTSNQGKQRGLRDLLAEEQLAEQNALNEIEYLHPFRYNRQAEAELLKMRQEELVSRIAELRKLAVAAAKP